MYITQQNSKTSYTRCQVFRVASKSTWYVHWIYRRTRL